MMKTNLKKTLAAVALSATALGAFAPSAFAYENPNGGQHFDRGRWPRTYHVAENGPKITCPGPECTQEFINDAVQRRVMTPKEAKQIRKIQSTPQASRSGGPGGGNSLAIAGGLAAAIGIAVAVGGGNPSSP